MMTIYQSLRPYVRKGLHLLALENIDYNNDDNEDDFDKSNDDDDELLKSPPICEKGAPSSCDGGDDNEYF